MTTQQFAQEITIGEKTLRAGGPCFVIAEAGINHNGEMESGKRLADMAKAAGADAVKYQTFVAREEVTMKLRKVEYQKSDATDEEPYYDMIKRWEFDDAQWKELAEYCGSIGIIFLSTPSEEVSARLLHTLDVPAYKIASNDLVTIPMLEEIAGWGKPIILSTGMAAIDEIQEALEVIRAQGNDHVIVLQCTSSYPTAPQDMNVAVLKTLHEKFGVLTGLSDHSLGIDAAPLAVLLGAVVVEKHITLDQKLPGPDQSMALELPAFTAMIQAIRRVEALSVEEKAAALAAYPNASVLLGNPDKQPNSAEIEMRKATRKGTVARRAIKAGEQIELAMLAFKRPYDGFPAREYRKLVNKHARVNISEDEFIVPEMLA